MKQLIRRAGGAAIALALAVAAPAAAATTPTRVVWELHGFTLPAGWACSFDVAGQPSWGFGAATSFPDGLRTLISERAHGAYVNVATGASYPTADNFFANQVWDPVSGTYTVIIDGEVSNQFLPGDSGPYGLVTEASFYHFVGRIWFTYDPVANRQTNFGYRGTIDDICAAIS